MYQINGVPAGHGALSGDPHKDGRPARKSRQRQQAGRSRVDTVQISDAAYDLARAIERPPEGAEG